MRVKMLIDTHSHIDMDNYKDRFDEVIAEAKDFGVEKIVIPGVAPSGFKKNS